MISQLNDKKNIIPEFFASILSIFIASTIIISRLGFENDILLMKIIRSYLSNLNLEEKIFSYPHELSGGELQHISLIRSIINNKIKEFIIYHKVYIN